MDISNRGHTSALYVWNGMSVFWGTSFHMYPYFHNTLQLVFDIDREFLLKDESSEWTLFSTAIIRASHTHQLDSNGNIQLFLYLDSESNFARKLEEKYLTDPNRKFRVKEVADHVYISESRLRHLFKEHVGQPIQNYILWMKVVNSLNMILKGNQISETAHETGFWDSPHMTRSYRELLGTTPGAIKKYEDDVRVISCGNKSLYSIRTDIFESWNKKQLIKTIQL